MFKILLVEDDTNLREIYAARLTAEKYNVASAADGEEALAKAVAEKPDLIILDIMMPKISGFDVLDILRQTPETKEAKVIILTALSQEVDRARGEKLGVDKYLVKSQITLEDLVDTVKTMLSPIGDSNNTAASDDTATDTVAPTEPANVPAPNAVSPTPDPAPAAPHPDEVAQAETVFNKPAAPQAPAEPTAPKVTEDPRPPVPGEDIQPTNPTSAPQ